MARMIDADELKMFPYAEGAGTEEQIAEWIEQVGLSEDDTASRARDLRWKVIEGFINVVKTQPTLTPPNDWISVKDKLPELPNDDYCWVMVLACKKTSKKSMPMFYERSIVRKQRVERWKYYWDRIATEDDIPDFWMPLPQPPKEAQP